MKMACEGTQTRTTETSTWRVLLSPVLVFAATVVLLSPGCQLGTGDVGLKIDPEEINYGNVTSAFREYFQVTARDIDTEAVVSGYPIEISMDWAGGGCGGPIVSEYWSIENWDKVQVPCPWRTYTEEDGTLRFFVRFAGTYGTECKDWGYSVSVFGREGSAASANGVNTCEQEDPNDPNQP